MSEARRGVAVAKGLRGSAASAEDAPDQLIYRQVRDAIIDHRIPPGTPLPEDGLAAAFGVSRTLVRRALLRLGHERLIELRRNRGAQVSRPSREEAREVFEARRLIEASLIELALAQSSAAALAALRAHLVDERAAQAAGDRRRGIRLSGEFHLHIARLARNRVLVDFLTELVSRTSLILALYETPGAATCGADDHAAILDALVAGDADGARQAMERHLHACEARLRVGGTETPIDFTRLFAPLGPAGGPRRVMIRDDATG